MLKVQLCSTLEWKTYWKWAKFSHFSHRWDSLLFFVLNSVLNASFSRQILSLMHFCRCRRCRVKEDSYYDLALLLLLSLLFLAHTHTRNVYQKISNRRLGDEKRNKYNGKLMRTCGSCAPGRFVKWKDCFP